MAPLQLLGQILSSITAAPSRVLFPINLFRTPQQLLHFLFYLLLFLPHALIAHRTVLAGVCGNLRPVK